LIPIIKLIQKGEISNTHVTLNLTIELYLCVFYPIYMMLLFERNRTSITTF